MAIIKGDRLEGELRGFAVSVTIKGHVTVRVDLKGLLVSTVSIADEENAPYSLVHYTPDEHEIGDEILDALAHIQGDERLLAAMLSRPFGKK